MNTLVATDISGIFLDDSVELSVVLPVFNEVAIVGRMHERLQAVLQPLGIRHELLFVDDGSQDGSTETLLRMAQEDPLVKAVILEGHAGKEAALAAGLSRAAGRAVIIMDADLQDPPERIPDMVMAWRAGADVVRMCRTPAAGVSVFGAGMIRSVHRILGGVIDAAGGARNTDFLLYSRKAVTALSLIVGRKRYMAPMFAWMGLRETAIEYQRQPRLTGSRGRHLAAWLQGRSPRQSRWQCTL